MMKLIFIFFLFNSLTLADVSYNMQLIANLNEHTHLNGYSIGITGYTAPDGKEYAILCCNEGTAFIDISDTSDVHEIDFLPGISSDWRDVKIWSHYAYIVGYVQGCALQIADLQYLPDSIHFVKTYSFPGFTAAHTLQQSGPYLYVNGLDYIKGGVFILDLSADPENPVKRGEWEVTTVHDCRIMNDTIWACNGYAGTVTVISAVDKNNLFTIASWQNGFYPVAHNCDRSRNRKYLYTTDETFDMPRELKIWNIEDLQNVLFSGTWHPPGIDSAVAHNIEIYGDYALIAYYSAGIRIADITDPANPVEAAYYDTYPNDNGTNWNGCKGVFLMPSGKIIANDKQTGLYVLKTTFPIIGIEPNYAAAVEFSLSQNYPNPFNPVTNIQFNIPLLRGVTAEGGRGVFVKLTVYDLLGRDITTLVNRQMQPGSYNVDWDASNYPSGVYFYKIEVRQTGSSTGDFFESKKMVLVK
ncbi:MAG: choice-of-anchor B family protein [Ignavibacteria bacterium]|nr:choice-of-anchor B family protein [Ignavibacteria bacterium]